MNADGYGPRAGARKTIDEPVAAGRQPEVRDGAHLGGRAVRVAQAPAPEAHAPTREPHAPTVEVR
ncbi:hypothetical protein [Micromonospora sp. URMC 103]|uniref:hypothetical protein n=1 Tax=Micromonospora sp. URMC 103 TaxID=3423406 RepID=UPI003F1D46DE